VQSKDGWRVTLPGPVTIAGVNYAAERSVVNPTLIAGTIFFPTFSPTNNFCASDGNSYLYVLFYKTGTASTVPVIGTAASGANTNVTTKIDLGVGLASAGTMHIGEQQSRQHRRRYTDGHDLNRVLQPICQLGSPARLEAYAVVVSLVITTAHSL
jgi:hypothetical protein